MTNRKFRGLTVHMYTIDVDKAAPVSSGGMGIIYSIYVGWRFLDKVSLKRVERLQAELIEEYPDTMGSPKWSVSAQPNEVFGVLEDPVTAVMYLNSIAKRFNARMLDNHEL